MSITVSERQPSAKIENSLLNNMENSNGWKEGKRFVIVCLFCKPEEIKDLEVEGTHLENGGQGAMFLHAILLLIKEVP